MKRNFQNIVKFSMLVGLALSFASLATSAQIYKSVDENGIVAFSNVPPLAPSSTKSTIVKLNLTKSAPGLSSRASGPEVATTNKSVARTISTASLLNNTTIQMGAEILDVTAKLGAPFTDDELLALYLDNEMLDLLQSSKVWTLTQVIRGPHTRQVRRISRVGETISGSDMITIFILRPSVLRAMPR